MNQDEVETDWQNAKRKKNKAKHSSIVTEQEKNYFDKKKNLFLEDKVEANPEQIKDA